MTGDRSPVRFQVRLLSKEAGVREKLRVYRSELSRLREEGGPSWVVRWYEERIRGLEEELRGLGSASSSSSSASGSSPSKPKGKG